MTKKIFYLLCSSHRVKGDNCSLALDRDYKFYLSFENSLCDHYATEKFFMRMKQNILPVVLGGSDYSKIAPPHSYINALNFDSPAELGRFLSNLARDDEKYVSYFWWKSHYKVRIDQSGRAKSFCKMCEMLNNENEPEKIYSDMSQWWVSGSHCLQRGSHQWSGNGNAYSFWGNIQRALGMEERI